MVSFCSVEVLDPHTGSAGLFYRDTSHGAAAMALKDAWGRWVRRNQLREAILETLAALPD